MATDFPHADKRATETRKQKEEREKQEAMERVKRKIYEEQLKQREKER